MKAVDRRICSRCHNRRRAIVRGNAWDNGFRPRCVDCDDAVPRTLYVTQGLKRCGLCRYWMAGQQRYRKGPKGAAVYSRYEAKATTKEHRKWLQRSYRRRARLEASKI